MPSSTTPEPDRGAPLPHKAELPEAATWPRRRDARGRQRLHGAGWRWCRGPFGRLVKSLLCAARALAECEPLLGPAQQLADLADEAGRPLQIALVGQFKAGKSSLLNALIGEELLVADSTPATAVETVVRYGRRRRLIALYHDGRRRRLPMSALRAVSTAGEGHMAEAGRGLVRLDVLLPHPRLRQMALIDTPGLHSGDDAHTLVTHATLGHVDAVLWVFSFAQAGTSAEAAELARLPDRLKPLALVNQIDLHDAEEEDLAAALSNIRHRLGDRVAALGAVSARQALHAISTQDEVRLRASGLPAALALIERHASANAVPLRAARLAERLGAILSSVETILLQGQADAQVAHEQKQLAEHFDSVMAEYRRTLEQAAKDWQAASSAASFADSVQKLAILPGCVPGSAELNGELTQARCEAQQLLLDIDRLNAEVDPVAQYAQALGIACAAVAVDPSGKLSSPPTDLPAGATEPGGSRASERELELYSIELKDRAVGLSRQIAAFGEGFRALHRQVQEAITAELGQVASAVADRDAAIASLLESAEEGLWGERAASVFHDRCVPALGHAFEVLRENLSPDGCAVATRLAEMATSFAPPSPSRGHHPPQTARNSGGRRWAWWSLAATGAIAAAAVLGLRHHDGPPSPQAEVAVPRPRGKRLRAKQAANVRAGPSTRYEAVAVLQADQPVVATDYVQGWAKVYYAPGRSGWVWRRLLTETPTSSGPAEGPLGRDKGTAPPRDVTGD